MLQKLLRKLFYWKRCNKCGSINTYVEYRPIIGYQVGKPYEYIEKTLICRDCHDIYQKDLW